ncbi:hypothetical protein ES705_43522 [subsurface metagenome]
MELRIPTRFKRPLRYLMSKVLQNTEPAKPQIVESYSFKDRFKNPEWSIDKLISLRPCLIRNKSSKIETVSFISEIPKWMTILEKEMINEETGEIIYEDYQTNDFKASKGRKIRTVNKFCDYYEPLFRKREVSLLFHTFTRLDYSKKDMITMMECAKRRYKALNRPIRGYLWALELKKNEKMNSGYNIHYHLVVAIDRYRVNKIPERLKFEDLWGQRTGVEFVRRSVRAYLSKYLYKSDCKLLGRRSYAISRNLI